jgi:hypothetical protein
VLKLMCLLESSLGRIDCRVRKQQLVTTKKVQGEPIRLEATCGLTTRCSGPGQLGDFE